MTGHYLLPTQDVPNQRSLAVQEHGQDTRNLIVRVGGVVVLVSDGLVCLSWSSIVE